MFFPLVSFLVIGYSTGYFIPQRIFSSRSVRTALNHAEADSNVVKVEESEYSFVNKDMRAYAMKLHTPRQSPKEGKAKENEAFENEQKAKEAMIKAQAANPEVPVQIWQPARINYVQFLVDSLLVYETMESVVQEYPVLESLKKTGLERSVALKEDLDWFVKTYPTIVIPPPGIKYDSNYIYNWNHHTIIITIIISIMSIIIINLWSVI
jgi:hypothetical protein